MTEQEMVRAIQSHFGDTSAAFKTRIEQNIPFGIELFCAQAQWEFLDRFVADLTVSDSTVAAPGKPRIETPGDFFKPVVIYTQYNEVKWIDRLEWARKQTTTGSGTRPQEYTLIGDELVLSREHDGSQIDMVYTRKAAICRNSTTRRCNWASSGN
jgi:hypothetical protein